MQHLALLHISVNMEIYSSSTNSGGTSEKDALMHLEQKRRSLFRSSVSTRSFNGFLMYIQQAEKKGCYVLLLLEDLVK